MTDEKKSIRDAQLRMLCASIAEMVLYDANDEVIYRDNVHIRFGNGVAIIEGVGDRDRAFLARSVVLQDASGASVFSGEATIHVLPYMSPVIHLDMGAGD